ncbi:hypothetical protein BC939DRAFT_454808 [Gamsiella multidivaricata]|uniref:uncharacterized protein n=1 Tax=Gamsiella multidivaricata TaxID=101098 RepID=UPI00222084F0|nr:uncharacterized protein BC939DRAFT_454808 [Gamsiella multidivaricata]KAI7821891.1 hypothetical protein BC939DRAFT_454808 [Gamsiella multidivaricata]
MARLFLPFSSSLISSPCLAHHQKLLSPIFLILFLFLACVRTKMSRNYRQRAMGRYCSILCPFRDRLLKEKKRADAITLPRSKEGIHIRMLPR